MSLLLCFQTVDHRLISSKSLVACIVPTTRSSLPKRMHIWELFNEYYGMKVSHISTNKSRTDLDFLSQTFIRITNKLLETCLSSCLFKLPNRVILWTNLQCSDSYLISLTSMGLVLLYSNHRRKPKRDLFSFVSWACARYIFTCYICFLFSTVESTTRLLPDGCPRRLVSRCMPQTRSQLNRYDRKLMASLIRGPAG